LDRDIFSRWESCLKVTIHTVALGSYREVDADRSGFQSVFAAMLRDRRGSLGRTLDIGCGPEPAKPLLEGLKTATEYHGVDPDPAILGNSRLDRAWNGEFETANIPKRAYDTVLAYNVVEHIPQARPFFESVAAVLKPNGEFWALSQNAMHPFSKVSNIVRVCGLKSLYRKTIKTEGVNEYPAYYRLNSPRQILEATEGLNFASAEFWFVPCTQWDSYFPRPVRFLPHAYDRLIGTRCRNGMQILVCRLIAN